MSCDSNVSIVGLFRKFFLVSRVHIVMALTSSQSVAFGLLSGVLLPTLTVFAVDQTQSLMNQPAPYYLIGVISDSKNGETGVAVLKDAMSQKTATCKVGAFIGNQTRFKLQKVMRNMAVISDESSQGRVINIFQESTSVKTPVSNAMPTAQSSNQDGLSSKVQAAGKDATRDSAPDYRTTVGSSNGSSLGSSNGSSLSETPDPNLMEEASRKYKYYPREPGLFERWYSALNGGDPASSGSKGRDTTSPGSTYAPSTGSSSLDDSRDLGQSNHYDDYNEDDDDDDDDVAQATWRANRPVYYDRDVRVSP